MFTTELLIWGNCIVFIPPHTPELFQIACILARTVATRDSRTLMVFMWIFMVLQAGDGFGEALDESGDEGFPRELGQRSDVTFESRVLDLLQRVG